LPTLPHFPLFSLPAPHPLLVSIFLLFQSYPPSPESICPPWLSLYVPHSKAYGCPYKTKRLSLYAPHPKAYVFHGRADGPHPQCMPQWRIHLQHLLCSGVGAKLLKTVAK
jgi:hypothetical protein